MRYNALFSALQNLMPDRTKTEYAKMLGLSKQNFGNKLKDDSVVSVDTINLLKEKFNIDLTGNRLNDDCITIEHIGIKPECGNGVVVYDEPDIRPIRISADTITRYMRCSNPSNLKAFTARGDSMRPLIDDGDTVLVDIGRTDIVNQGVFVYTSNNEWRIKRLNLKLNGTLEVISDNPTYEKEYLTPDDNIDIVIRGRVVLNLSRSL